MLLASLAIVVNHSHTTEVCVTDRQTDRQPGRYRRIDTRTDTQMDKVVIWVLRQKHCTENGFL